jgi:hypothetical protein
MDQQSLQQRFVRSLQDPPLDLLDRLEHEGTPTIWSMGTGTGRLANQLVQQFSPFETLFLCDPTMSDEQLEEVKQTAFDGELEIFGQDCLQRLGNFPQDTFEICLACWMVGTVPVSDTISMMYRVLGSSGQIGLICMKEGSPEQPLRLLKQAVRDATGRSVDFRSRGQLANVDTFRSNLTSLGFGDERVWSDSVSVSFNNPDELFAVLLQSTGTQWKEQNQSDQKAIRKQFVLNVEQEYGPEPTVTYQYLGATGKSKA